MIGLNVLLWVFVVLFAIIGYARGYKRELLVLSSVILTIYVITVLKVTFPSFATRWCPIPAAPFSGFV